MTYDEERIIILEAQIRRLEAIKCFRSADYRRKELEQLKSKINNE